MKKRISSELLYLIAIITLALSINLMAIGDLGMSMIVCPAFIISQKFSCLSYGQAEYIVAAGVFILFCVIMKKFKLTYLSSFITGVLYATMADILKALIPAFQSSINNLILRIGCFTLGMVLAALAIAMFYETYLYPQIYDFFVKKVSQKYNVQIKVFKTIFDLTFLIISILLSFGLFNRFVGIGVGTVVMVLGNGNFISKFQLLINKYFICTVKFKKLYLYLED